jgi:hypothetical protein
MNAREKALAAQIRVHALNEDKFQRNDGQGPGCQLRPRLICLHQKL